MTHFSLPIKAISLLSSLFFVSGCNIAPKFNTINEHPPKINESKDFINLNLEPPEKLNNEIAKALAQAQKNKDYRLLQTATRGVNIPGLPLAELELAVKLCGSKYFSGTGDVITSEKDKALRKERVIFMKYYNKKMWLYCQSNK